MTDQSIVIVRIANKLHVSTEEINSLINGPRELAARTDEKLREAYKLDTPDSLHEMWDGDEPTGLALFCRGKLTEAEAQLIDGVE